MRDAGPRGTWPARSATPIRRACRPGRAAPACCSPPATPLEPLRTRRCRCRGRRRRSACAGRGHRGPRGARAQRRERRDQAADARGGAGGAGGARAARACYAATSTRRGARRPTGPSGRSRATVAGGCAPERAGAWDEAELGVVPGLRELGFADAFRALHGYGAREPSWTFGRIAGHGGGWRLDHVFCSAELEPVACAYHHEWRDAGLSDHSALEADLDAAAPERVGASAWSHTITNLLDVEDSAAKYGYGEQQESRFARADLERRGDRPGLPSSSSRGSASRSATATTRPRRSTSCIAGSGCVKLDDERHEVRALDAIRIAPGVARGFEAGRRRARVRRLRPAPRGRRRDHPGLLGRLTSSATRWPLSIAPSMNDGQRSAVCAPAKWTRPSGARSADHAPCTWPGRSTPRCRGCTGRPPSRARGRRRPRPRARARARRRRPRASSRHVERGGRRAEADEQHAVVAVRRIAPAKSSRVPWPTRRGRPARRGR